MKDEILEKALPTDQSPIPRYQILDVDGSVLHDNVEVRLVNDVQQTGTPYSTDAVLQDAVANSMGLSNTATPNDAFKKLASSRVVTLNYSNSGTQHFLTGLLGLTGIISCVFTPTAPYKAGDAILIGGTQYTIQLSNGDTASDNLFVSGATVSVILDTVGKKVNFKAGGGYVKGDVIAAEYLEYAFLTDPTKMIENFYGYDRETFPRFCCCFMSDPSIFATQLNNGGVYKNPLSVSGFQIATGMVRNKICPDLPDDAEVVEFDNGIVLFCTSTTTSSEAVLSLSLVDFKSGQLLKTSTVSSLFNSSSVVYIHRDVNGSGFTIRGPKREISTSGSNVVSRAELIHLDENLQETHRIDLKFNGSGSDNYYYNSCFLYDSGYFYGLKQVETYDSRSCLCKIDAVSGAIEELSGSDFSSWFNELVLIGETLYIFHDEYYLDAYKWGGNFNKIASIGSRCENSTTMGYFYYNRYSLVNGLLVTRYDTSTYAVFDGGTKPIATGLVPSSVVPRYMYRGSYNSDLIFLNQNESYDFVSHPPFTGIKILEVVK